LERGIYYAAHKESKKLTSVSRRCAFLPGCWHICGVGIDAVSFNDTSWSSMVSPSNQTAFKHAVTLAKLGKGASPHTLRYNAATWLMQNGAEPWQAPAIWECPSKLC